MRTFDMTPLMRSTVGFDRMSRLFDAAMSAAQNDLSYPPYNIEKVGDTDYRITMAVAGFRPEDLSVTVQENTLLITGQQAEDESEEKRYLHRGIARRAFERRFQLADGIRVQDANIDNGLLHVELVYEIPEAKKPRQIEIHASGPKTVTHKTESRPAEAA